MSKTVMIVEDNEMNMVLFNTILKTRGYETVQVCDGGNVLEDVRRTKPDLILLDIRLPNVSGVDVVYELKTDSVLRSIPVVALTAFAAPGDEQALLDCGCDGYISKPIAMQHFLDVVEHHLAPLMQFPMAAANLRAACQLAIQY